MRNPSASELFFHQVFLCGQGVSCFYVDVEQVRKKLFLFFLAAAAAAAALTVCKKYNYDDVAKCLGPTGTLVKDISLRHIFTCSIRCNGSSCVHVVIYSCYNVV